MANWVRLGPVSEIPAGGCRVYDAGENRIAVFHVDGAFHAIDDTCVHRGGPLSEGTLDGKIVSCPWHFWQYDVTTGRTTFSSETCVRVYALELRENEIFADIS